jgi:hypothetical protein
MDINSLATTEEIKEVNQVLRKGHRFRLKRTFNMDMGEMGLIKYWRIIGPTNAPQLDTDLSLEGLKYWNIIL